MRRLVVVLGDQLDRRSAAFDGFAPERDAVWMAEVAEEATHVRCHKLRIALFFSAMRHFRAALEERGVRVHYRELRDGGLAAALREDRGRLAPEEIVALEPGDWRVREALAGEGVAFREDDHFYASRGDFAEWAEGRRELRLEDFYRWMRRRHGILLDGGGPAGGAWNYDRSNREPFGRNGPGAVKAPRSFRPDRITREVLALVERRFPDHPGSLEHFDYPVTRRQALAALRDFVDHRLRDFGRYQDAMWTGRPYLHHSRLSAPLNLHLLRPQECVAKAVAAYEEGDAPIESVEGFVRQVLGWREFVRGIYWREMPGYAERNALQRPRDADVPRFFWDGETEMVCVRDAMRSVLDHGYAHHIQRLMVLGLYALLAGVHPYRFHEWHLAMYVDAIDWVSLPNALGMSQYGDGGIVGTKPYCASGRYIDRMSDSCGSCRYDPRAAVGEAACPFTTLYWDFLDRHGKSLEGNRRMGFQLENLRRKDAAERRAIRRRAEELRA